MSGAIELRAAGADVLGALEPLVRTLALETVPKGVVPDLVARLHEALERHAPDLPEGLRLRLAPDSFSASGEPLRPDPESWIRLSRLARVLRALDAGDLAFGPGATRDDVLAFARDLRASLLARSARFSPAGYGPILLGPARPRDLAAVRAEPDRLAVHVLADLTAIVAETARSLAAGVEPPVLALRRKLQRLLAEMARAPGPFLAAALVRDPGAPLAPDRLRMAVVVDVAGAAVWLGLPRRAALPLALAAAHDRSRGGDEQVEVLLASLLGLPVLGGAAVPVSTTLRDAAAARAGLPSRAPGQLVAVARAWQEALATTDRGPGVSPRVAAEALRSGRAVPGADRGVVDLFLRFKGPIPVATPVELTDGHRALVLALDPSGRPCTVLPFDAEGLGEPLDLRAPGAPRITRILAAVEAGG